MGSIRGEHAVDEGLGIEACVISSRILFQKEAAIVTPLSSI